MTTAEIRDPKSEIRNPKSEIAPSEIHDEAHARAVLHRRALRLANEADPARQAPSGEPFLALRLGPRERYGIPYRWLDEIVRPRGITPVPGMPDFVAGVMARHGQLLAVLDLARLVGIPGSEDDGETRLVLVSAAGYRLALRVAEVYGNDRYRPELLGPALPGSTAPWNAGIHAGDITMLDLEALLADPRIRIEEHA